MENEGKAGHPAVRKYLSAMEEWRDEAVTDLQKEKLQFFGCTWDEGITKGQASDALDQCVTMWPDKETEWRSRPATREQLDELGAHGFEIQSGLTFGSASEALDAQRAKHGVDPALYREFLGTATDGAGQLAS
jgi:hypothetical protein